MHDSGFRSYHDLEYILCHDKNGIPALLGEESAAVAASLVNKRLLDVFAGNNSQLGFIYPEDPLKAGYAVTLKHFNRILDHADHMYEIGENNDASDEELYAYNLYRATYLIACVYLPEYEMQIIFRLRAFKFPKQISPPKWRSGSIIIYTPLVSGFQNQCRWSDEF